MYYIPVDILIVFLNGVTFATSILSHRVAYVSASDFEGLENELVLRQSAGFIAENEIYLCQILVKRKVLDYHADFTMWFLLNVDYEHLAIVFDEVDINQFRKF